MGQGRGGEIKCSRTNKQRNQHLAGLRRGLDTKNKIKNAFYRGWHFRPDFNLSVLIITGTILF